MIAAVIAALIICPLIGGLLHASFDFISLQRGYLYCGATILTFAVIVGYGGDSGVIGWGLLGILCITFWLALPFVRNLFSGKYDERFIRLFRE